MALDLANGYLRKDSASASNVYFGYANVTNPGDSDAVWAIRRVNTAGSVETINWTNNDPISYNDTWSGRTFSFVAPTQPLNLTWSTSTSSGFRQVAMTWSSITGVSKYIVTSTDQFGKLLDRNGLKIQGYYVNQKTFTENLFNNYAYKQTFLTAGTYSISVSAHNFGGSTTSTATINFSS